MKGLSEDTGNLSSLKSLTVDGCWALESLPDSLSQISTLKEIKPSNCWSLKTLPDSLGRSSLSQGEGRIELAAGGQEPSSHSTVQKGLRVSVKFCDVLKHSIMRSLGWVKMRSLEKKNTGYRIYRRGEKL
jgi:hypothetical protein